MGKEQATLSLRVINGNQLESGKKADFIFTTIGGSIGSSDGATWPIQDSNGRITPLHTAVAWRDGAFCLLKASAPLLVNDSTITTAGSHVRLQQGDMISLGDLQLKVYLSYDEASRVDPASLSPESLVSRHSNPLEDLLADAPARQQGMSEGAMAATVRSSYSQDPLTVLKSEQLTTLPNARLSHSPLLMGEQSAEQVLAEGRYQGARFASSITDNNKERRMDRDFIDLLALGGKAPKEKNSTGEQAKNGGQHALEQQHVAITPLMRGLGSAVPLPSTQEAWEFLEEAGNTLRAAIEGLLALHQVQESLSDKQLRPLEDNPLRLNLDYEQTLSVLFGDQKSPVHLAAPSAVGESLHNLRLHYQANIEAIQQALSTMLDAFSPQALLSRFTHYRRSSERGETDAAWAWQMYCSYYQELASSRQHGFEKLFHEVYAQAYDRALRRRQQESEA